ncbi:MAG: TraB/GumN family protein [Erysipelotrichaceae bacterium]|nr:TraB/GumN family protein [Erysipelotrichaceae bacterium]
MNDNIVRLEYKDKEIYLVKTAHVSKNSVEDVRQCIEEIDPDSICIELDGQRYEKMNNPDQWRDTDIIKIIRDKQVGFFMVNLILASFQRRMAKTMDSSSGGEMMEAIRLSKEKNKELVLADRSIKTTFARIWANLSFKEKISLLAGIITSIFDDEEISEEELQALKQADAIEAALNEVAKEFPTVKRILVDERDQYLSMKIKNAPGNKVVAVIGAAHAGGIERNLNNDFSIEDLENVESKKGIGTYLKWAIPLIIIGLLGYTLYANRNAGMESIKSWIIFNGCFSALGTLLAGGHILSIITAFIMSPITSLNPLLAAGFFAGFVEAYVRKPKVKDFEDLNEDAQTLKGFYKNKVTRTLMVVLFANIFSSIGTFVSSIDIVRRLFQIL